MVCKAKIFISRTLSTRHYHCLLFSLFCFRLNSSMRNKTGILVFWESGVHYPRVSPSAHPLTKKPEDSGYEIALHHFSRCLVCSLSHTVLDSYPRAEKLPVRLEKRPTKKPGVFPDVKMCFSTKPIPAVIKGSCVHQMGESIIEQAASTP